MFIFLCVLKAFNVIRNFGMVNRSLLLRGMAAGLFSIIAYSVSASPCDGVDRSLSSKHKSVLATKIAKELRLPSVDVLQSFRSHGWSIIYIDPHESDGAFLFYPSDPLTSSSLTSWGGAASIYEEEEIKEWVLKNTPKIPLKLASCFAWYVTHDRNM